MFCLAPQPILSKAEPPTILPHIKDTVSKPTPAPEKDRSVLPETQLSPPVPKRQKDIKPMFELEQPVQSMLGEINEHERGPQPTGSVEKDTDAVWNMKEKSSEKDNKVDKNVIKPVQLPEKDHAVDLGVEENEVDLEKGQPVSYLEKSIEVDMEKQSGKETEVSQTSKQPIRPFEKTNAVEKTETCPEIVLLKNSVEPLVTYTGKETMTDKEVHPTLNEREVDKAEAQPLKPPVRAKGKIMGEIQPLKYTSEDTGENQSLKSTINADEENKKQRDNVKQQQMQNEKTQLKAMTPANQLDKQQSKFSEKEAEFAPPKPPVRTKAKTVQGTLEKQISKDTETDQDEKQLRCMVKTSEDLPSKNLVKPLEKDNEDKPQTERKQAVTISDIEIADKMKQQVKAAGKEADAKQPIKQPVKPLRIEPESNQEIKVAVEPMRREDEQQTTKMTVDVPLLYISEDDTFSEALTEVTESWSLVQPMGSFVGESTQPSTLPLVVEMTQPSKGVVPETEDEPQLQEAAVKIRKDTRPLFKEVFKNQTADLHGTVTLVCTVEGNPSTVRWLKDGQQITNDKRCHIETTEDGVCTLVITNLMNNDSGFYTCEVVNKFGVSSYNGNITVVQPQRPSPVAQKPVHPPFAAITPLQLAPPKPEAEASTQPQAQNLPQTEAQIPTSGRDAVDYVESVSVSLWEAYNLTEQDTQLSLQDRRSSLIASSSK